MSTKKMKLVERITELIEDVINNSHEPLQVNFSHYLCDKLDYDYGYLATLFSQATGTSIEQYIIAHKIERVKQLIAADGLSITEIAEKMHYSSVAHLSNQFKKTTGLTPSAYKKLHAIKRTA